MADPSAESVAADPQETHHARRVAESFGTDAEAYDRARPRYPDAMIQTIVAVSPGGEFVDVGIGTGIAARQFQEAGCTVLGVEVDERMADFARSRGFEVEVAKFEDWDPAGRTFDALTAGQTWHWVDPVEGAAKAASILRPAGRVALFWNVFELPDELREPVASVHQRVLSEAPFIRAEAGGIDAYAPQFSKAADGLRAQPGFSEPEQWRFDWSHGFSKEAWLEQVPTYGGYNLLPPEQLRDLLAGLGDAIDGVGGTFEMRYATIVVTAELRGS